MHKKFFMLKVEVTLLIKYNSRLRAFPTYSQQKKQSRNDLPNNIQPLSINPMLYIVETKHFSTAPLFSVINQQK